MPIVNKNNNLRPLAKEIVQGFSAEMLADLLRLEQHGRLSPLLVKAMGRVIAKMKASQSAAHFAAGLLRSEIIPAMTAMNKAIKHGRSTCLIRLATGSTNVKRTRAQFRLPTTSPSGEARNAVG